MKKLVMLCSILFIPYSFAMEETPLLIDTSAINFEIEENNTQEEINVDKMNKAEKIQKAKDEIDKASKKRIKIDARQLQQQRALDYSTKQMNATLPMF